MRVWPCEQPSGGNVQSIRKAEQQKHRNIVSTQFNVADIPVTYARSGGQCPLGQPSLLPIVADSRPKELQGWIRASRPFSHDVPREEIM